MAVEPVADFAQQHQRVAFDIAVIAPSLTIARYKQTSGIMEKTHHLWCCDCIVDS